MSPRDLRLLPLAGAAWASALLCIWSPAVAGAVGAGAAGVAIMVIVLRSRRRDSAQALGAGLIVVVLAGVAATAATVMLAYAQRDTAASCDGRVVEFMADITSASSVGRDGRLWFEVGLTAIGTPGGPSLPSAAPARIGVPPGEGFELGAGVRVTGRASATEGVQRPAVIVFGDEGDVVRPATGVFGLAAAARQSFIERATRLPEPGAGLLPGLAVGDVRAVPAFLNDDMRTSGLSHLTAVSGANCAVVVGAVFWVTALCGGGRAPRVLLSGLALGGFVVLVTPEPSVVRAAVMAGVAMLAVLLGKPNAGAGLLSLCVVGILIVDPWLAGTPGFALSVAASGALILLAPPLSRGLGRWMAAPLALAIAVPLAAQLACGPIIALFAEQQSLVGVAANIVAAPAAPIATVIGLLACVAAPLPAVADVLAASAWLPASWIAMTAEISGRLPLAQVNLPPGLASAALVAAVSVASGVVLSVPRIGMPTGMGARAVGWMRGAAAGVLAAALALGASHMLLSGPLATATTPDGWAVAACDVGQGDAVVVRSASSVALVDVGPEPAPLESCLRSLGVERVDMLVLTHFDLDHIGGIDAVIGRVGTVLHGPVSGRQDERVLSRLAAEEGAAVTDAASGLRGALGEARWRVLWPQRGSAAFAPGNDTSVVIEFDGGGVTRSLFLGDLAAPPQRLLMRTARLDALYAVVKVAHHGSADQDSGLYAALRPAVALVTVGAGNSYGHPRRETLELLNAVGAHVLRTDERGRVLLGLGDGGVTVWTEPVPGGEAARRSSERAPVHVRETETRKTGTVRGGRTLRVLTFSRRGRRGRRVSPREDPPRPP